MKHVIFTDLDGTLLDARTYSLDAANPALELVRKREIPLVLCSSKTRGEIESYRRRIGNRDPFISENGGGIFIPMDYFSSPIEGERLDNFIRISLGAPYRAIRETFVALRKKFNAAVRGYGDMTVNEISALTGLSIEEARLARQREFEEPFVFDNGPDQQFLTAIEGNGLRWTRGRFYHIMGNSSKGKAVRILKQYYENEYGRIRTIALGDAYNDLSLLQEVDFPVLIKKEDGTHDPMVVLPGLIKTEGIGPAGWNEAIVKLLLKR